MKLLLLVVVAVATAATAAAGSRGTASPAAQAQLAGPPPTVAQYGHIRSLVRKGSRYELRFDPAFWLGGVTAQRAAEEDGLVQPGEPVPNDYYVRDERRRALTYLVPGSASVTVVTNAAGQGLLSTRITVAELAQILKGRNPRGRALFDRQNALGYWICTSVDAVRSLDQQYQP